MDDYYMQGAYLGVPYKIRYDEDAPWDLVDPRNRIEDVIFMGFGGNGHVNYGETHATFCEETLRALVSKNIDVIIKNSDGRAAAKLTEDERADREEEIFSDLSDALSEHNMDEVKKLLGLAGIEYRAKYLTGDCQGQYCETLYFFEDGRKFDAEDDRVYKMEMTEINSWLWGHCYSVEVGNEACGGFVSDDCSNIDDKSPMSYYVKEQIDILLKQKKGPYTVVGDYASMTGDYDEGKVVFDRNKKVKIHVDSLEEAKTITGVFNGHAVLIENDHSNQK